MISPLVWQTINEVRVPALAMLLTKPGRTNMRYFLKKIVTVCVISACAGGVHAAALEETDPIGDKIQGARSLSAVYEIGNAEYEKRHQTWESLKEGQDESAKKRSVDALRALHHLLANRSCELTGLTPEWSTDKLRIKKGFLDATSSLYETFRDRLSVLTNTLSKEGKLKAEAGEIYGRITAWAGQRAVFYSTCIDLYKADTSSFKASGAGHAVAEYSKGYVPGSLFGEYIHPTNMYLMMLSVSKEETDAAADLAKLMTKFHEALSISSLKYGPYVSSALTAKRDALEGNLPIHKVREYLQSEDFWKGEIPEELKTRGLS